jgi:hypothetical protein
MAVLSHGRVPSSQYLMTSDQLALKVEMIHNEVEGPDLDSEANEAAQATIRIF